MLKVGDRVKHSAYGVGTVKLARPDHIIVNFDIGISPQVQATECAKIGVEPSQIQSGDHVTFDGHTVMVDEVSVVGNKVFMLGMDGHKYEIPRWRTTVQIIRLKS